MAKEVAGHAALIEKLRISPYRVGLQWVAESMLMGRPVPESDFPFVPLSSRPSPAPRKMTGIKNKKAGGKVSSPSQVTRGSFFLTRFIFCDSLVTSHVNSS